VLRGDGIQTPYQWVWILNPPPPPPPPAAAPAPSYGGAELQRMVAARIALAREAAAWSEAAPDVGLMAPRRLALVNFRDKACIRVRDADGRLTTTSIPKVHETYGLCV
jgi:hypothetical protein